MRAYVPATLPLLAGIWQARELDVSEAVSVTDEIRSEDPEADEEEHEYVAFVVAADASAALLMADPQAPRRRVVVAVDVPAGARSCGWSGVAAVHADEADIDPTDTELHTDLLWYAPSETPTLIDADVKET